MRYLRRLLLPATLSLVSCAGITLADERQAFVDQMVAEHGFDAAELQALLGDAQRVQSILDAISRPAEALPWWKYRRIFLTPERAAGGVEYWQQHAETLARAEAEYGVPPEIIVAVIGVETFYGRYTGKFAVLDALYTLGFHYPKRAKFFRKQLGEFLLLAREESVDPRLPMGSYAGAMGRPQFIPSSYRAYAVDFDRDGKRDIWDNDADVIGSVANYFARHNWRSGAPITRPVSGVEGAHASLLAAGMKPSLTVGELRAAGLQLDSALPADAATSLIELEQPDGLEHWAGLDNFYVITRYNHSNLYAMAVYQLSREILNLHNSQMAARQRDG
jgi:membrane-bound lytic murein transglycosylase B